VAAVSLAVSAAIVALPGQSWASPDLTGRVNTSTAGYQLEPSVGMDASGGTVVVWTSRSTVVDGSGSAIVGQRFGQYGEPLGGEFLVNTTTAGEQSEPSVAVAPDGGFAVAWTSSDGDGTELSNPACGLSISGPAPTIDCSLSGIRARRFNADGSAAGGDFLVNGSNGQQTYGWQYEPDAALRPDGSLIVAWTDDSGDPASTAGDGSGSAVFARVLPSFYSTFLVATTTAGNQYEPSVALAPDGSFAVAWTSEDGATHDPTDVACGYSPPGSAATVDCSESGIRARRFSSYDNPEAIDFLVNGTSGVATYSWQGQPDAALRSDGDLIVTWADLGPAEGANGGIFARVMPSFYPVFQVNTSTTDVQAAPSVTVAANGEFQVAWASRDGASTSSSDPQCGSITTTASVDCSEWGIRARRYAAEDYPLTSDFLVNGSPASRTGLAQVEPSIATGGGRTVVAWTDHLPSSDGSDSSIQAMRYGRLPSSVADEYTVGRGATLTVAAPGVLANDSLGDSYYLNAELISPPAHGTLTLEADGSFTYTHDGGTSTTDLFRYRGNDGVGHTGNIVDVSLTITSSAAHAPVAVADSITTSEDTASAPTSLLANDSDADGDLASVEIVTAPASGLVQVVGGQATYTPVGDWHGADSFTYRAVDAGGLSSDPATVTVTVTPVNDAPVAAGDAYTVPAGGSSVLTVLTNDSDVDADALTPVVTTQPTQGTVTVLSDGTLRYDPAPGVAGSDSFSYAASDGSALSAPVQVTLTLEGRPAYRATVQQPINATGDVSTFRASKGVVPVKWTLARDDAPTCTLPAATIRVVRLTGGATGPVDESVYGGASDAGTSYRVTDCRYHYNVSAPGLGAGGYRVEILIGGEVMGSARFELR
jgi:hypothetical protein